ncbi:LuxQ periplasmic sensor domain-containing protein [Vibrio sp. 99-8-1]|uniref:LuxQ periplasmic sensor domain-containing protein n=1 Tax=Vibrio sp. 99-8-1 TaxID=2607602 RepID=UPI0014935DAE|nr:LuxQ periplasmic sensor domain-containing protein [Vibrio sp. 99-8-1]NOI66018.1 response regulator [Vibrio sp. 99-8-1]
MIFTTDRNNPRSMASLTVRLIFLVFTVLVVLLLGFSFQYSATAVNQEIERNLTQTSTLLQSLFDYKLGTMTTHQNSQAKSVTLQEFIEKNEQAQIDDYFFSVEKADLKNTPDFRFITRDNKLYWDDGNALFFGIESEKLKQLTTEVAYNNNWHFTPLGTEDDHKHLLIRRMPIIKAYNGEVLARFYIVVVLDNNFSMVESLKSVSNTQDIVLLVDGERVASTIMPTQQSDSDTNKSIQAHTVIPTDEHSDYLFNNIGLKIDGIETPISLYVLQDNASILLLEDNYKLGLFFSILSILATALLARVLIQKRLTGELAALVAYTQIARDQRKVSPFKGSIVSEFDHIGHTLENTFEELIEKEQLFQDLFNFALSPIIVWDSKAKIIRMNPAAEKAFQENDIHIERVFQTFQQRIVNHIDKVATGEVLTGVNIPISNKVYRWNLSPILLENGVHSIIGQGLDITSLIDAEKQSNYARLEAEKAVTARAEFMARMSHEIRTPLNGILGISQLLKKSTHEENQLEKIDVLHKSGEHLLAVLNDILDFSKIEQGKLSITKKVFQFSTVVSSIERIYSPLCDEKQIELVVENQLPSDARISTDQVRLNQILFNLLSNAVKFTHAGSISVRFSLQKVNENDHCLTIVVEDTGVGISKQNLESIFEPFVQSESTITREYGGSGLGLSIVKLLVEMLGGDIQIESTEYQGTTIRLNLMVDIESTESGSSLPGIEANKGQLFDEPISVLLVEDNKTNAFIAKAFCEKYGLTVDWAKDGLEALEKLKQQQYQLILMDNQMPGLGGIEVTSIIRNELKLNTAIFACTADGFESTKLAFVDAGANYVMVKPIKEAALYDALLYYKTHLQPSS